MGRRAAAALAGVLAFALTGGCILWTLQGNKTYTRTLFAMDTVMLFTAQGPQAPEALEEALAEVQRLDALLSAQSPDSEVSRLNAGGRAPVSEDTARLLKAASELGAETGGLYDCTVYPLMELWGFPTKAYRVPRAEEIAALLPLVDGSQIRVTDGEVELGDGQRIDLGGIAKGYASARVMEIFKARGVSSAMVTLGGNVQTLGERPEGGGWRIGVQDPLGGEACPAVIEAKDVAVVTSGGYQRYFEEDGKRYIHILDPRTGAPAESDLLSATVVSPDGTLADALSTAVFVMGLEDAAAYWQAHEGFELVLITNDGAVYVTEGLDSLVQTTARRTTLHRQSNAAPAK